MNVGNNAFNEASAYTPVDIRIKRKDRKDTEENRNNYRGRAGMADT